MRRQMTFAFFAFNFLTALVLTSCGQTSGSNQSGIAEAIARKPKPVKIQAQAGLIQVIDMNGTPVAGAQVMIGSRVGMPFSGNMVTTDANGQVAAPNDWRDVQPVTIEAKGFVRATYFGSSPDAPLFQIRSAPTKASYELKGETLGYEDLSEDGIVDVGLVMPSFDRRAMTTFKLTDIVSLQTDNLSVIGRQYKIPSNLAIPTQTESYILPLTLSKPTYRMYFPAQGTYGVSVVHARFTVDDIASGVQGNKPILDMLNKFNFTEGSTRVLDIKKASTPLNFPIADNKFQPIFNVTAPNFGDELNMLAFAVPESNGWYSISDVKAVEANQKVSLMAPHNGLGKGLVIGMLRRPPPHSNPTIGAQNVTFSAVIRQASQTRAMNFLELVAPPVQHPSELNLQAPRKLSGVTPTLTYAVMSKVEVLDNGPLKVEKITPQWELYSHSNGNDWATDLNLPQLPTALPQTPGQMRWEAMFLGQAGKDRVAAAVGPEALEKATHVTRTAVDF